MGNQHYRSEQGKRICVWEIAERLGVENHVVQQACRDLLDVAARSHNNAISESQAAEVEAYILAQQQE